MTVRPIRDEESYDAALQRIDELMGNAPQGSVEGDELELLVLIVNAYEEVHHPMPPPSPVGAIRFMMDQQGLSQRDLEPYIGPASRVSEILSGKRQLTVSMIRKLHLGLGIPLESLIAEQAKAS